MGETTHTPFIAFSPPPQLWLDKQTTVIQAFTRHGLAKGKFVAEKLEMDVAAALIERCWRGYWGRRTRNERLYARETAQRQNQVRLLGSEEQHLLDHIRLVERRVKKAGLAAKNEELEEKVKQMHLFVEEQEFNFCELTRQKEAASPRALEQGWVEELAQNAKDHRNLITKYKLDCLFDTGLEQRQVAEDFARRADHVGNLRARMNLAAKWREEVRDREGRKERERDEEAREHHT